MPRIHFLNVKNGDCSIIQHYSGNVTMIDVCNAELTSAPASETTVRLLRDLTLSIRGNFGQKSHPVNPIEYLGKHNINEIMRFVLTHPDMDHMDGIKAVFDTFRPLNFWDTDNTEEKDSSGWASSPYEEEDWVFYRQLRDGKPSINPKRLALLSGKQGRYYNQDDRGGSGDGLHILAPTQYLVDEANRSRDFNDCSYVLMHHANGRRTVFGGDSHDKTWDHILKTHESKVSNIDLLIAPHHGRDSGRSYDFLDVLRPKLTFFGYAPSEHLAYRAWNNRGLPFVTNNQANCMVVDISPSRMKFYATYETYARASNPSTYYDCDAKGWYVQDI